MKKFLLGTVILSMLVLTGCDSGMSREIQEKTLNSTQAIANYEWFKRQESQIKAMYNQEKIQQAQLDDYLEMIGKDTSKWSKDDRSHYNFLNTVVMGTRQQVNDMVGEYNARVSMENKSLFKDSLPTNIFRGTATALEFEFGLGGHLKAKN